MWCGFASGMNNLSVSSLEQLAVVKISALLWNNEEIYETFPKLPSYTYTPRLPKNYCQGFWNYYDDYDFQKVSSYTCELPWRFSLQGLSDLAKSKEWQEIESKVTNKAKLLPIPKTLKEKLVCLVGEMGLEILRWVLVHYDWCDQLIEPNSFYYTPNGAVDYKRMAETLIEEESLNFDEMYQLACIYCLKDKIISLWDEVVSKIMKEEMMNGDSLVSFWSHYIEGKLVEFDEQMRRYFRRESENPYMFAFQQSAGSGYMTATVYFFEKVNMELNHDKLISTIELLLDGYHNIKNSSYMGYHNVKNSSYKGHHAEVLWFLMSQMDESLLTLVLKKQMERIIDCFLNSPFKVFLFEIVDQVIDSISSDHKLFVNILCHICNATFYNENNQKLFRRFWQLSPSTCKNYVINEYCHLLQHLLLLNDKESVKLILEVATPTQKKNIFTQITKGMLVCPEKRKFLEFLIEEISLAENEMPGFINEIEMHLSQR